MSKAELEEMLGMSYPERATKILMKYLDEYDEEGLLAACDAAFYCILRLKKFLLLRSGSRRSCPLRQRRLRFYPPAYTFAEEIDFTVPTGNFGNILAAYYAEISNKRRSRLEEIKISIEGEVVL